MRSVDGRLAWLGALCAATLLITPACDLFDDDDLEPLPFESLAGLGCLAVLEPGSKVFLADATWETFWLDHVTCTDGTGAPVPPPAIDFSSEMLIAVHWGAGYTGCSGAVEAIGRIGVRDGRIEVHVGPLPDLGECDAVVQPIQVVRCPRSDLPVVFFGAPGD